MKTDVLINEVGPRDGLQHISGTMPTEAKRRWLKAQHDCGCHEIEVGAFLPAQVLPQLADTAELVDYCHNLDGLRIAALVTNRRGASDAIGAGVHKLTMPFSASETVSRKYLRRSHAQMFEEIARIRALVDTRRIDRRPRLRVSLGGVFGAAGPGEPAIVAIASELMDCGCDEVALADTMGQADPLAVRRLVHALADAIGRTHLAGIHLRNTHGLALANALTAYECGLTGFDASLGGLGSCPAGSHASGNIVTEDLVFMFESMGVNTGIDLEGLLRVREILRTAMPGQPLHGFTAETALPHSFRKPCKRSA